MKWMILGLLVVGTVAFADDLDLDREDQARAAWKTLLFYGGVAVVGLGLLGLVIRSAVSSAIKSKR